MSLLLQISFALLLILFRDSRIVSQESEPSYFFYRQPEYPRDCKEVKDSCNNQISSGVYLIKPDGYHKPFEVYCDNDADSGGWTVIQRRHDGSVTFQRDWSDYKAGFGFLSSEFWVGNEKLSFLTNQKTYELRIDFTYPDGSSFFAVYNLFRISDEFGGYNLVHLGLFTGTSNFRTCPNNKEYVSCTCEKSCGSPNDCLVTCTEEETCICPGGFYLNENYDCVPQEECGCFSNGIIIPEGGNYRTTDCSRQCNCSGGRLVCDQNIQCSSNAVCEERNGLRKCYCNDGYTGDGITCTLVQSSTPTDCLDVYNNINNSSGVYNINPTGWTGSPFQVYCNMTDGGGWTVFQRREDGSVDFDVDWDDYKDGFGTPDSELWLGNEKIFSLTNQRQYQLRIDFVNFFGNPYFAKFGNFRINNEASNYRLTVENYNDGDAGNSFATSNHNGQDFSTRDRDNDDSSASFAKNRGAWWYGVGLASALNAQYGTSAFRWNNLPEYNRNIKYTEMKIRPV